MVKAGATSIWIVASVMCGIVGCGNAVAIAPNREPIVSTRK